MYQAIGLFGELAALFIKRERRFPRSLDVNDYRSTLIDAMKRLYGPYVIQSYNGPQFSCFLLIDGLDQLGNSDSLLTFLQEFRNLKLPHLQVLPFSRFRYQIEQMLVKRATAKTIELSEARIKEDIVMYVNSEIQLHWRLSQKDESVKERIRTRLKQGAVFRWAYLQMEALKSIDGLQSKEIDEVLAATPGDLFERYDAMLEAIGAFRIVVVKTILNWLLASRRSLYVEEALELCKLGFKDIFPLQEGEKLEPVWLTQALKDLIKVIPPVKNWTVVAPQSHTVDWAHSTVKEYLTDWAHNNHVFRTFRLDVKRAHFCLAGCSIAYLFCTNTCDKIQSDFPLRHYARDYWLLHARHCQEWGSDTEAKIALIYRGELRDSDVLFKILNPFLAWMDKDPLVLSDYYRL